MASTTELAHEAYIGGANSGKYVGRTAGASSRRLRKRCGASSSSIGPPAPGRKAGRCARWRNGVWPGRGYTAPWRRNSVASPHDGGALGSFGGRGWQQGRRLRRVGALRRGEGLRPCPERQRTEAPLLPRSHGAALAVQRCRHRWRRSTRQSGRRPGASLVGKIGAPTLASSTRQGSPARVRSCCSRSTAPEPAIALTPKWFDEPKRRTPASSSGVRPRTALLRSALVSRD